MRQRRPHGCTRSAFTLIELTLVVLTIAILSAIAMPRYGDAVARYRLKMAAQRIVTDLELTRELARAASAARTLTFDSTINGYRVSATTDLDRAAQWTVSFNDAAYGVIYQSSNLGGDSAISFNGYGMPDSGGTISLVCGNSTCTVTVDAVTGRASFQ